MLARAAVFDMDGTLLRLEVDIEEVRLALARLFRPFGVERVFRPVLQVIPEAAAAAAQRGGDPDSLRAQALAIVSDYEVRAAASARGREGVAAVVSELARRGVPLGIVTDNGRACLAPALRAAGLEPAQFVASTRDDVMAPKPDPEGLLRVLDALGVGLGPGAQAWYVGDHPKDMATGRAARALGAPVKVAALVGGLAQESQLRDAGADVVLATLADVLTLQGD